MRISFHLFQPSLYTIPKRAKSFPKPFFSFPLEGIKRPLFSAGIKFLPRLTSFTIATIFSSKIFCEENRLPPLYLAISKGDRALILSLLSKESPLIDSNLWHYVAESPIPEEICPLLSKQLDFINEENQKGKKPLDIAIEKRNIKAVKALIQCGGKCSKETLLKLQMDALACINPEESLILNEIINLTK